MNKKKYISRLHLFRENLEDGWTIVEAKIWYVYNDVTQGVPLAKALEKYELLEEEWEEYKPADFGVYFNPDCSSKDGGYYYRDDEKKFIEWSARKCEIRDLYKPKYKKPPLSDFFDVYDFIEMLDGEMSEEKLLCSAVLGATRRGIPMKDALKKYEVSKEQYHKYFNT